MFFIAFAVIQTIFGASIAKQPSTQILNNLTKAVANRTVDMVSDSLGKLSINVFDIAGIVHRLDYLNGRQIVERVSESFGLLSLNSFDLVAIVQRLDSISITQILDTVSEFLGGLSINVFDILAIVHQLENIDGRQILDTIIKCGQEFRCKDIVNFVIDLGRQVNKPKVIAIVVGLAYEFGVPAIAELFCILFNYLDVSQLTGILELLDIYYIIPVIAQFANSIGMSVFAQLLSNVNVECLVGIVAGITSDIDGNLVSSVLVCTVKLFDAKGVTDLLYRMQYLVNGNILPRILDCADNLDYTMKKKIFQTQSYTSFML